METDTELYARRELVDAPYFGGGGFVDDVWLTKMKALRQTKKVEELIRLIHDLSNVGDMV